jgi:hypothetical protein
MTKLWSFFDVAGFSSFFLISAIAWFVFCCCGKGDKTCLTALSAPSLLLSVSLFSR